MAERSSWATSVAGGQISVEDARIHLGAAMMNGGSLVTDARSGFLPTPSTISAGQVTANGSPNGFVNVAPFVRVQQSVRGKGCYIMVNDASKSVNILSTPADPTNQRNDLIIAQQSDAFYGDANSLMVIKQIVGTPAGSPVDPTVTGSSDYVLLARVRVTAGAVAISAGLIDDLRPTAKTVAQGAVLPIASVTERNAIALPFQGMTIFRTDRLWHEVFTSGGWQVVQTAVVTNFSDLATFITAPFESQTAFVVNDGAMYRYHSGVWGIIEFVQPGFGYARYAQTVAQSIATTTDTAQQFNNPVDTCPQVTASGTGNQIFTLNIAGIWTICANTRFDTASVSAGERVLWIQRNNSALRVADSSHSNCPTGFRASLSCSTTRRFAANDTISSIIFQSSGGAVNTDIGFPEANTISMNWEGP